VHDVVNFADVRAQFIGALGSPRSCSKATQRSRTSASVRGKFYSGAIVFDSAGRAFAPPASGLLSMLWTAPPPGT
jgi:hypothetical protein